MDRRALRRAARAAREAFVAGLAPPVRQAMEAALAARVRPAIPDKAIVASHAAVGPEIDPFALEAALPRPIAFPRVGPGGSLEFLVSPFGSLRPGYRGIPEPPEDAPAVEPTLLLVPLLLFDSAGNRLGQGGGHYDRAIRRLRGTGPLVAIGLAWDMQEVDALVPGPWDEPLDAVATPTRLLRFRGGATGVP